MTSWRSWTGWLRPLPKSYAESSRRAIPASGWSLRFRLLIFVGLVLLLPALLSILQGISSARRDVSDIKRELIATTRAAATPAENIFAAAREILQALSSLPAVRNASPECSGDLAAVIRDVRFLTNITRIDAQGNVVCAALPQSVGLDARHLPIWKSMSTRQAFVVSGVRQSRLLHRPIVLALLPLHDAAGRFQGTLNTAIDVRWLDAELKTSALPQGSVMALFDGDRRMIAATNPAVARELLGPASRLAALQANARTIRDHTGTDWTFATAPLLGSTVFVGVAMPETRLFGGAYTSAAIDIVLPFAMILLTWLAIWIVTDRQLIRWIIYLRRVSLAYRGGHYALRPALDGAPSELRGLGDALAEMAASIDERDRSLREAIAQKSLLIKEIHHRVKNNLQVVMSLLSLQAKRLSDPAAQRTLADTRTRINALALVHRVLYEIDDETTVDIKRLLELLAEQTHEGFSGVRSEVTVTTDVIARHLPGEMAVPLSLFTVEAMTNAFKHAFPAGRRGAIRIVLEVRADGVLRLAVEDDGVGFDPENAATSIGGRLIKTFGEQVGGTSSIRSAGGQGTTVEIVFPDVGSELKSRSAP